MSDQTTSPSLLNRLRQPEDADWRRFVDLYTPLLWHWAAKSGLQPNDANELIQEVFLTLLKVLPTFQYNPSSSFRAWLHTVLRNKWQDLRRKQVRMPVGDSQLSQAAAPDELIELEESEYRRFLILRGMQLVEQELGATTVAAFRATAIDGRAAAEVGQELGLSENAVYQARRRVLAKLKDELAELWQ